MAETLSGNVTQLLHRWGDGDPAAFDRLVHEVYPELHAMASRYLSRERPGTIQATVLVHDLYLRLLKQERANFQNRRAFFGFAAGVMRHILIDRARARRSEKRGAARVHVPLHDDLPSIDAGSEGLLDLDDALQELAAVDPRKAELVQLCVFLGCSRVEAAEVLGISERTAIRDLRLARAWLSQRLGRPAAEA